ncbi:MAG: hypothetical protein U0514_00685 [Candidatus Andersenbacteria bacterium]
MRFGRGLVSIVRDRHLWRTAEQRLVVLVVVATIPGALLGYFGEKIFADTFRNVPAVALWFAACGAFYLVAEYPGRRSRPRGRNHARRRDLDRHRAGHRAAHPASRAQDGHCDR